MNFDDLDDRYKGLVTKEYYAKSPFASIEWYSFATVAGCRKLFHQARAQELVDYLNAEDDPDGWAYELEQGYNGPNKGVIGQYYIRVVDYSDGGYVIGYF
ncbi:MAG: hypothetical protein QF435_16745 [Arenicellales bacterium]|jgi:hypothetical protein|nr:hypothetical protein [Arenicellales bacterium]